MKQKNRLAVVLATYNEEKNIGRCLAAVADMADEIVVVDGSSTDKTREIAEEYGAKIIKTTNKPIFHINKQMAIDAAKGDWILQLDADEVVDEELKKSILAILDNDSEYDAFYIKRKNNFLGRFLTKGGQYPDPVIRLFKKDKASLPQKDVHEQMTVVGETGTIEGHLLHYTTPTLKRYVTNANRYTTLTAGSLLKERTDKSIRSGLEYLLIKPIVTFWLIYIRHKGFVDGYQGFMFALFSGLHFPWAYIKYLRMNK